MKHIRIPSYFIAEKNSLSNKNHTLHTFQFNFLELPKKTFSCDYCDTTKPVFPQQTLHQSFDMNATSLKAIPPLKLLNFNSYYEHVQF